MPKWLHVRIPSTLRTDSPSPYRHGSPATLYALRAAVSQSSAHAHPVGRGAARPLHWESSGPAVVLQWSCSGPAVVLQRSCSGPAAVLQRSCSGGGAKGVGLGYVACVLSA